MSPYPKRLIEVDLPIKPINRAVKAEASNRKGHPSSLHKWWATKPLASCRGTLLAALLADPLDPDAPAEYRDVIAHLAGSRLINELGDTKTIDPRVWLMKYIADYSLPKNANSKRHHQALQKLLDFSGVMIGQGSEGESSLSLLDPFCGSGAFVLEGLRLSISNCIGFDHNPVAVSISKSLIEDLPAANEELIAELEDSARLVSARTKARIKNLYPKVRNVNSAVYLWYRTCRCEGPRCGKTIPLTGTFWIHKNRVAVKPVYRKQDSQLSFELFMNPRSSEIPEGTVRRSSATCPSCGYTTSQKRIALQASTEGLGKVLALVKDENGAYRIPETDDLMALREAERFQEYSEGLEALGSELPYLRSIFNVNIYGMTSWCDLFLPRQLVAMIAIANEVRRRSKELFDQPHPFARQVTTLLALAVDAAVIANCTQSRWRIDNARTEGAFSVQALPMIWNFAELNPVLERSAFGNAVKKIVSVARALQASNIKTGTIGRSNAQEIPLPDSSVDIVATDPPYYDAVPYGNLSDFFYVWLRLTLGHVYPDLFENPLVDKSKELIQLAERNKAYRHKTKEWFEEQMTISLREVRRVAKPDAILILAYAHKETVSWEALIAAVVNAGWTVVASWPIDTELSTRMRAQESAVLASTIHLVCKPRPEDSSLHNIGDWRVILSELPKKIHEWMPRLSKEGVVGADAIFSCIGPALEIFSRYMRVEKASGEQVTLKEYLEHVWAAVAKEALNMIFEGADATGFEEDARLTAIWLWTLQTEVRNGAGRDGDDNDDEENENGDGKKKSLGGYVLEYDAARKIAQGLGAHLERLESLIEVKGEKARLLPVEERARYLFGKDSIETASKQKKKDRQMTMFEIVEQADEPKSRSGIKRASVELAGTVLGRIHQSMLLFATGRSEALRRFLVENGVGRDQRFWKLADYLSKLYPQKSDEKRWVDGVLARKKGLGF